MSAAVHLRAAGRHFPLLNRDFLGDRPFSAPTCANISTPGVGEGVGAAIYSSGMLTEIFSHSHAVRHASQGRPAYSPRREHEDLVLELPCPHDPLGRSGPPALGGLPGGGLHGTVAQLVAYPGPTGLPPGQGIGISDDEGERVP